MVSKQRKRKTRSGRKPKKRSVNTAEVAKEIQSYLNPFTLGATVPRIPDGKSFYSTGLKRQEVRAITIPITGSSENTLPGNVDFLLYPGVNNCCRVLGTEGTDVLPSIVGITPDQKTLLRNSTFAFKDLVDLNYREGQPFNQIGSDQVLKWRLVSAGLKITLINNAETNDGWFECARYNHHLSLGDWQLQRTDDGAAQSGSVSIIPTAALADNFKTNMANQPSYQTGRLRGLNHVFFRLKPVEKAHDFISLPENIGLQSTIVPAGTENYPGQRLSIDTANVTYESQQDALAKLIDESFDMVYIRLYGRQATTPTKLLCQCVMNYEIVYDNSSKLSSIHKKGNYTTSIRGKEYLKNSGTAEPHG